jgi:hypothetical protein
MDRGAKTAARRFDQKMIVQSGLAARKKSNE